MFDRYVDPLGTYAPGDPAAYAAAAERIPRIVASGYVSSMDDAEQPARNT